ncbi:MAG: UPF0149 family protein [Lysobacterales bacterium]|jgi:uncharacterized protein YgfB (UPF0149 family)
MSSPALPNFENALQLSEGLLDSAELAECHGLLCGLLSGGVVTGAGEYLEQLAAMRLLARPEQEMAAVMVETFETTNAQLADEELGFELWLPSDDEALEDRTISLAQWCSGYLAGLGHQKREVLSGEAREALEDLIEISRVEVASGDGGKGNEEEEKAFAEIVEYVRIVVLTLREEFRGPGNDDAIH